MKAILLLMLLPLMPAEAEEPYIQCPGENTVEMRWCASKSLGESKVALEEKLSPEAIKQWRLATVAVCSGAYKLYLQGAIYPQLAVECDDRLIRALLMAFKGLAR